jgi:hypothetical protein
VPLIYDSAQQKGQVRALAQSFATTLSEQLKRATPGDEAQHQLLIKTVTDFASPMYTQLVQFKNAAFSEEQEWRVVRALGAYPSGLDRINIRLGPSGFVPYLLIDELVIAEGEHAGRLPIREVRFGPSMHPELTEKGLRLLLDKHGYSYVAIRPSTVPLRVLAPSSATS